EVGRAEELERTRGAPAFGERGALEHDRAGVAARHPEIRCVGARVDPGALAERPAETRRGARLPALHGDDLALEVEPAAGDEPAGELAERHAVAHRQRAGAHEALPARFEQAALDRPSGRVGP